METTNKMVPVQETVAMFKRAGIDIDTSKVKAARASLNKDGAVSQNISDVTAVAAYKVSTALKKSDAAIKDVCKIAGVFRMAETWKGEKDDNDKPFKSENAFLKALFPGYATSTVTLYADVGATIYVPAALGQLKDLPGIEDLGPSNAKFLCGSIKDAQKRAMLPAALKDAKEANGGKLSQRAIQSAIKNVNNAFSGNAVKTDSDNAGTIADELSGGGISKTVSALIQWDYNGDDKKDSDLCAIVLSRNVDDFVSLLTKASKDSETASAVCDALLKLVKSAK